MPAKQMTPRPGATKPDPARQRAAKQGPISQGVQQGPVEQGPVEQGPVEQGPVEQGPVEQGPVEQGPVEQGPVEQGPVEQGPVEQGPVEQGPVKQGPVQQGPVKQGPSRRRNPRGQGERLRDDIVEAASRLLADPAAPPLTLRAVAREAGVAATSVYLHFDDIESLVLAVADRRFGELGQLQDEMLDQAADPFQRVQAGCLAYCEFGLAHQGHYQVMFTSPLPLPAHMTPDEFPGHKAFQRLIQAVAVCIGTGPEDPEALRTAQLIWQQLHGIVSLRISRPRVPWPPLAETVTEAVDRLLGARAAGQQAPAEAT